MFDKAQMLGKVQKVDKSRITFDAHTKAISVFFLSVKPKYQRKFVFCSDFMAKMEVTSDSFLLNSLWRLYNQCCLMFYEIKSTINDRQLCQFEACHYISVKVKFIFFTFKFFFNSALLIFRTLIHLHFSVQTNAHSFAF